MKNGFKRIHFYVLLGLIFLITLGYAYLTSTLNINGLSKINNPKWDIHFENIEIKDGSVSGDYVTQDAEIETDTSVVFGVRLSKPGDFYEFTVDVVNEGTIDAMIDSIDSYLNNEVINELPAYLDYEIKYDDGGIIAVNQLLKKQESETLRIRIGYKSDISSTDLPTTPKELNMRFSITYVQAKSSAIERNPEISSLLKKDAVTDQWINFSQVNGTSNGNGVFLRDGTENDAHPIYYYRGNITNNNLIFGDYCWKIVRTTSTGGTKILYNGIPNNGQCNNTGANTVASTTEYNQWGSSLSYACYSYGSSYSIRNAAITNVPSGILYGSSLDENGKLVDPKTSIDNTHHYSYHSADPNTVNDNVNYYICTYHAKEYITFDRHKTIEQVISEMLDSNNNKSVIHQKIDEWYENNILNKFDSYLEDTEWCLNRNYSINSWAPDGAMDSINGFAFENPTKKITCDDTVDRLSVANGSLDYPVALLDVTEVSLAGAVSYTANNNYYLYTGIEYWLLNPYSYSVISGSGHSAAAACVGADGSKYARYVAAAEAIRPAISLKEGTRISSGSGEPTDPYIIKTN